MRARLAALGVGAALSLALLCATAGAAFFFSTGSPDGKMAMGSRPDAVGLPEIEAADDFVVTGTTSLQSGTFTGLLPSGAPLSSITRVVVEIYRVFPQDSNVGRTSGAPTFSTNQVPTRVNSPSDVAFASRDSVGGGVSFTPAVVSASFAAANSVLNGIHPKPNQTTLGDGPVTGEEVSFNVTFPTSINLPADHYFFVPQVKLSSGQFLWLSAPKPIVAPGTPFPAGSTDLQAWIRNAALAPDWLRVGTDIVGGTTPPTFNGAFSLSGAPCGTLAIAPAALGAATAGAPFTTTFTATGGTAPYAFTETGALPGSVALGSNGTLAGTAPSPGAFPITVTASDAAGCAATESLTLTVIATPGIPTEPTVPLVPTQPTPPPAIRGAKLSVTTFRAAASGATVARTHKRRAPTGATLAYTDSETATTTIAVIASATGHRSGSRCVAGRPHRHQKRCTRAVTLGTATHADTAGASVKVRFSGRVRGHTLKPGHYKLTLTPKAGAVSGRTVTLAFRIVR